MPLWPNLVDRFRETEVMDQPNLDVDRHRKALEGLARINWWSRSAEILWPSLAEIGKSRSIRILDIACGGGDVALALWRKAHRAKLPIQISGCDKSATAIDIAAKRCRDVGPDIQFFQMDILHDAWPDGYDAIICSLFLHHLSHAEVIDVLRHAGQVAKRLVLVNDLVRCRTGLLLAHLAGRVLTRSEIVRIDGPRSVRAAFTCDEARELAQRANLTEATVSKRWPCRFLLKWVRPTEKSSEAIF